VIKEKGLNFVKFLFFRRCTFEDGWCPGFYNQRVKDPGSHVRNFLIKNYKNFLKKKQLKQKKIQKITKKSIILEIEKKL